MKKVGGEGVAGSLWTHNSRGSALDIFRQAMKLPLRFGASREKPARSKSTRPEQGRALPANRRKGKSHGGERRS